MGYLNNFVEFYFELCLAFLSVFLCIYFLVIVLLWHIYTPWFAGIDFTKWVNSRNFTFLQVPLSLCFYNSLKYFLYASWVPYNIIFASGIKHNLETSKEKADIYIYIYLYFYYYAFLSFLKFQDSFF